MLRYILLATSVLVGPFNHQLSAQPKAVTSSTLSPDDPSLFGAFFQLYETQYSAQIQADRGAPNRELSDLAALLRVTSSDLPKILAIATSHNRDVADINEQARTYVEKRKSEKRMPDKDAIRKLDLKHNQTIQSAIERCRKELASGSWEGLHGYINEILRPRILQTSIAP